MPSEICRADFVVREDYRVLARCEVEIEVPEGHPNIALFYQKTAGAAVRWCACRAWRWTRSGAS